MSFLPLEQWDHSLFEELQNLLTQIATQPTTSTVRRFFARLDDAAPWILALTHIPGPNDEDKRKLETEPLQLPSGSSVPFSGELLALTNEISTYLSISQRLAAVLVLNAESLRARYATRSTPEIATYILHNFLSCLLSFLHELLRLTIGPEAEQGQPFDNVREWLQELLVRRVSLGPGKGEGSLVDQLLSQVDELQSKLNTLIQRRASGIEYELLTYRVNATRAEQGKLVAILALIAQSGMLGRGQLVKVIKWLKKADRMDGITGTIFATFLTIATPIDSQNHSEMWYDMIEEWCRDIKFLKVASNLVFVEKWGIPKLAEAAKIAWSNFIVSTFRHDTMPADVGIDPGIAEQFFLDGINGEALQFLRDTVIATRIDRGLEITDERQETQVDALAQLASKTDPDNDIILLRQLQSLISVLISKKNFVRNLRNKEEDNAVRRTAGPTPLHYQAFLGLVEMVYKTLPPDSALQLWDDLAFVGFMYDTRGSPGSAFWGMLCAISKGKECAIKSYERMKESHWSFTSWCQLYQYYYKHLPHIFERVKTDRNPSLEPMGNEDKGLCSGWTQLITTLVTWSPLARQTLLQSPTHPLQALFDWLNCDIALDLKTDMMKCIAAFCKRTGQPSDEDTISKAVDYYEWVTFSEPNQASKESGQVATWLHRMDAYETELGTYPLSRAYLEFLTTLLPESGSEAPVRPRLLSTLGKSTPFILDHVFLSTKDRGYIRRGEKVDVYDVTLAYIEKALLGLDHVNLQPQASVLDQPGVALLLRLLSENDLLWTLSLIFHNCLDEPLPRSETLNRILIRILRIYHKLFTIQSIFTDDFLRTLEDSTRATPHPFRRPVNIFTLDRYFLNNLADVNAIALLVGDRDLAIAYLATKLMSDLATSSLFRESDRFTGEYSRPINRLAGIVDASDDSLRISQGFCLKLDSDGPDISPEQEEDVSKAVLGGDITPDALSALPMTIRSTILDFLLDGTSLRSSGPNLAHFLLGFEFKGHNFSLQDPDDPDSRQSCFQILLDQMTSSSTSNNLLTIHPVIAAKSARLMYQLFSNITTARSTISHATSVQGFSVNQLAYLPRQCPPAISDDVVGLGKILSLDLQTETTADNLVAYLNYQRDVLSCVALETHAYEGHGASASDIAELLFSGVGENEEELEDEEAFAQRPPLILDLLSNIDLQWQELPRENFKVKQLEFYGSFYIDQYRQHETDLWDIQALKRGMRLYRRHKEKQGMVGQNIEIIVAEEDWLLHQLNVQNRELEINLAKGTFLTSWSDALKVALGRLFSLISEDRQEVVLLDLLDAILDRISGDVSPGVSDILSESTLVTMSKLVEVMMEYEGINLPVKQLTPVFARVIDALTKTSLTETARGNLYASVNQYLSLLSTSSNFDDTASLASTASLSRDPSAELRHDTLAVLAGNKERFISALCQDAMDVRDVWKTECFALLGAIIGACHGETSRQVMSGMIKDRYLTIFVRSLKDREIELQQCLSPDSATLHAYWVFEAKITFLLAYASSRKGAEELVDAGLFEILAMCGFMSVLPMTEDSLRNTTHAALSRQHRVFVAVLQLVIRTLTSLHRSSRSGTSDALSFSNAHRDTLLLLLRENQEHVNSDGIEECRLIVSLLTLVHHKVSQDDKRSPSAFGAFHLATLSIAAKFFDENWTDIIEHETEAVKTQIGAHVLALNQVLLAYLAASTTNLKSDSGYPVLVNGGYRTSQATKFIASAPSLQGIVETLSDLAEQVQDVSEEYQGLSDQLADGTDIDTKALSKLYAAGLLSGPATEGILRMAFARRTSNLNNMIETIMLLVWRHLLFYANDTRGSSEMLNPDNLSLSLANRSTFEASRSGAGAMRSLEKVAASLRGVLDRISEVDIHSDLKKSKGNAYFNMLMRRLRELSAGLTGDNEA